MKYIGRTVGRHCYDWPASHRFQFYRKFTLVPFLFPFPFSISFVLSFILISFSVGYKWRSWKYGKALKDPSVDDLHSLLVALEENFEIDKPDDWLRVTESSLPFGKSVIHHFGGWKEVLTTVVGVKVFSLISKAGPSQPIFLFLFSLLLILLF